MFSFLLKATQEFEYSNDFYSLKDEPTPKIFNQIVDHFAETPTYFGQRYYDTGYSNWTEGDPIFLYISSESDNFQDHNILFVKELAQDFHAKVLTLEHRYYGESYPTQYTAEKPADLTLLTVEQAVEDLEYFRSQYIKDNNLPNTTKTLLIGASYPGALAAFTMRQYGDRFAGAISSSGVVHATIDYEDFDLNNAIAMGPVCSHAARQAREELYKLLPENYDYVLKLFGLGKDLPYEDFHFIVGEIMTIGLQYGNLEQFCAPLEKALYLGNDLVSALAEYSRTVFVPDNCSPIGNEDGQHGCIHSYSREAMKNYSLEFNNGPRHWLWQTCYQVGFWQVASNRLTLRPHQLTQDYYLKLCQDVFGAETITKQPDVDAFNAKWGSYDQKSPNVIYTTGSQDPWTWTCITEDKLVAEGSYAHTIKGHEMAHGPDLKVARGPSNPPDLVRTWELEKKLVAQWLSQE